MRNLIVYAFFLLISAGFAQNKSPLSSKSLEALAFCKNNHLNTNYCFLVDLSVHSGKNRFYVYDFKLKKVTYSGLVCHGVGKNSSEDKPVFSNVIGSNCTSLGKYKVGKRAYSNWGINIHYKMHGLEKTNSNAAKRNIVLHSYDYVSEKEIFPNHLTLGWSQGCPVIANGLMKQLDKMLKKTTKPTLIWIYQ